MNIYNFIYVHNCNFLIFVTINIAEPEWLLILFTPVIGLPLVPEPPFCLICMNKTSV